MGKVVMHASVSIDGFIALPDDSVGPLFDWYGNGDVEVTYSNGARPFRVTEASAGVIRRMTGAIGAQVIGRRLFDLTNGWDGVPANGDAVVVVTHAPPADWEVGGVPVEGAPFEFVDDVTAAVTRAKELAGDRDVVVAAGNVGGEAFALGLIDRVDLALVPVVLGSGVRYFGDVTEGPALLENPEVIPGDRVTHLAYDVRPRNP